MDDEPDTLNTMGLCLRAAGYAVLSARDGKEAARFVDEHSIDVVVTDLLMPKADGIELLMHIKAIRPGLPVIAVSGGGDYFGESKMLDIAVKMGARLPLSKPFTPVQLLDAVQTVCPKNPRRQ